MVRTKVIGCRVGVEVKAAARRAANDDHRSIASLLEKLLVAYLRRHGHLPETHPGGVHGLIATATATATDTATVSGRSDRDGEAVRPPLT